MLGAAARLSGPPLRARTIRALLLVLYCTGLRFGEAVRLRRVDVDLRQRLFLVRESKGKTRLVPFLPDLAQEISRYRRARDRVTSAAANAPFFVQVTGRPFNTQLISATVRRLLRRTGLKPTQGRVGPRPYDLRHSFAVHRLTRWYRGGVEIHARLPWLSAYLGHDNLLGTEVYLTATPELLAVAGRRLRAQLREARRPR